MIKYAVNITRVPIPKVTTDCCGSTYSVEIAKYVTAYLVGLYSDEDKAIEKKEALEELFLENNCDEIVSVYVSEVEID